MQDEPNDIDQPAPEERALNISPSGTKRIPTEATLAADNEIADEQELPQDEVMRGLDRADNERRRAGHHLLPEIERPDETQHS